MDGWLAESQLQSLVTRAVMSPRAPVVDQVLGALDGSASVVMTQDLTAAQVVVATTSKLRSSPKVSCGLTYMTSAGLTCSGSIFPGSYPVLFRILGWSLDQS